MNLAKYHKIHNNHVTVLTKIIKKRIIYLFLYHNSLINYNHIHLSIFNLQDSKFKGENIENKQILILSPPNQNLSDNHNYKNSNKNLLMKVAYHQGLKNFIKN